MVEHFENFGEINERKRLTKDRNRILAKINANGILLYNKI